MTEKTPHVLVVDDDWMARELIEAHLEAANYRVSTAGNGKTALELAHSDPPDLIMLDAKLPDLSGFEVCRQLKSDAATHSIPVVFVTSLESDEDRHKGIQVGAADFVSKSFNHVVMIARIRSLIRVKQLNEELHRRAARYLDSEVAEAILRDFQKQGDVAHHITVIFASVSRLPFFTEKRAKVTAALESAFAASIEKYHSDFDKYTGEEITALFNVTTSGDPKTALRVAQEMQTALESIREQFAEDLPKLSLEVGLHQGDVQVGQIGSAPVINYLTVKDIVTTAHHLLDAATDGQILLSETLFSAAGDRVQAEQVEITGLPDLSTAYQLKSIE